MNLRIFSHRNYVRWVDGPPCNKDNIPNLRLLKKINNASLPRQHGQSLLEHREDLDTLRLSLKGLNKSLNHSKDTVGSI